MKALCLRVLAATALIAAALALPACGDRRDGAPSNPPKSGSGPSSTPGGSP
jgi:hypothetical protein